MRRVVTTILTIGLLLGLATPRRALAEETASGSVPAVAPLILRQGPFQAPISLDLPARAAPHDAATEGVRRPRPPLSSIRPRPVLSEDGWLVVGAAAIVGVLLLVVVVGGLAD